MASSIKNVSVEEAWALLSAQKGPKCKSAWVGNRVLCSDLAVLT